MLYLLGKSECDQHFSCIGAFVKSASSQLTCTKDLIETILEKQENNNIKKRRINNKMSIRSRRKGKKLLKEINTIPLEFRMDNVIENQKVLEIISLKCYYCFSNFQNFKLKSSIFSDLSNFKTVFYLVKINQISNEQQNNMNIIANEKQVIIKDFIMERVVNKFQNIKNFIKNINNKTKCKNECSNCISEPKYLENLVSDLINISKIELKNELECHNHLFRNNQNNIYEKKELALILEEHYNHFHSKYLNQNISLNNDSNKTMSSANCSIRIFSDTTLQTDSNSLSSKQPKIIIANLNNDKFCYICKDIYKSENEINWITCDLCGDSRLCGQCATSDEFTCLTCINHECEKQRKSRKNI